MCFVSYVLSLLSFNLAVDYYFDSQILSLEQLISEDGVSHAPVASPGWPVDFLLWMFSFTFFISSALTGYWAQRKTGRYVVILGALVVLPNAALWLVDGNINKALLFLACFTTGYSAGLFIYFSQQYRLSKGLSSFIGERH